MPNELTVHQGGAVATTSGNLLQPNNLDELQKLGTLMAQSGFFSDARGAAQACVKIMAGREMGFPPIASMVGISIIDGKPATGANLLAAAMKRAGYSWRVLQRDAKGCRMMVLSPKGAELGPSEFLEEDAKRAELLGKKNWNKYPRSMYFARAISDAARTYAPEVFAGVPPYTADELGAEDTTQDGAPIAKVEAITPHGPTPLQQSVAEARIAELQAQAAQVPTTPAPSDDPYAQAVADFRAADKFGKLKLFAECKRMFAELAGDESEYYRILGQNGVQHSDQFKSLGAAVKAYRALLDALSKLGEALKEPEPAAVVVGDERDDWVPDNIGGVK